MTGLNLWQEVETELKAEGFTAVRELTTPGSARARVWLADYQNGSPTPEKVAVKVSSSFLVDGLTSLEADSLDDLAQREARIYQQLSAHPNIPAFRHFNTAAIGGLVPVDILAVQYVDAPNLLQRIHQEKKLTEGQAKKVLADTLSALVHVHTSLDQPIYHRDIKPSNILFDEDKAYLFDFNFARIGDATRASRFIENLYYPMDALGGGKPTQSQDLVALGNTIIAAAYGLEIEGVRSMQHKETLAALDLEGLPFSLKLKSFLRKLTTSNPALRYQTAAQALDVLKNLETIAEEVVEQQLATITRSSELQQLLKALKEQDTLFDYNVPSSLRTTLDDDALLEHLRRTYAREEFIVNEPEDVERYLSEYGDLIRKKGTFTHQGEIMFKSGWEGTVKGLPGSTEVYVRFDKDSDRYHKVGITNLVVVGKKRSVRKNTRFPEQIIAETYPGGVQKGLLVRYVGPDSIKAETDITIPDGALGVVTYHNQKRKDRTNIDIAWINQPALKQRRSLQENYLTVNYALGSALFTYKDIAIVRKNHIHFDDLYRICFEEKPVIEQPPDKKPVYPQGAMGFFDSY